MLHATTSTWSKEKVKGFAFTPKVVFNVITIVTSFSAMLSFAYYFSLSAPLSLFCSLLMLDLCYCSDASSD